MVRLYLRKRYTKTSCPEAVFDRAHAYFGGFGLFGRAKVIHCAAVWQNPRDGKYYSMNINEEAPKCTEDFWTLNFLRTYADCIVTTGQILRKEPAAFDPGVLKPLGLPYDIYFNKVTKKINNNQPTYKGKPVAILTRDLQLNFEEKSQN